MKSNLEIYKIWAPDDALWSQWAKPVLFMNKAESSDYKLEIPEIYWIQSLEKQTMIIVDLPGQSGVIESLALARLGYRPVPLYNGVDGRTSLMAVNVGEIVTALYDGAELLTGYNISPEAPPVFMLDSNRMNEVARQPGTYDNRWCVFPQDMPSATFLINAGIREVIVRSYKIQDDLAHILLRYQKEGIEINLCKNEIPRKVNISIPPKFKRLSYRFGAIFGLIRNSAGGFGGKIPEPTQSGAG